MLRYGMAEPRPAPRGTKIAAGAVFGGLAAAVLGQRTSPWVLASQAHTIVTVAAGAVVVGLVMFVATMPKASG
jgi:hypothetical protein